jgi:hypothetical protein
MMVTVRVADFGLGSIVPFSAPQAKTTFGPKAVLLDFDPFLIDFGCF